MVMLLTACSEAYVPDAQLKANAAEQFAKYKKLDQQHASLDCDELVSQLTPHRTYGSANSGVQALLDYVAHEEEVNKYEFSQCRGAIHVQAIHVCEVVTARVGILSSLSTIEQIAYGSISQVDSECIASMRTRVKESALQYHVRSGKVSYLVVDYPQNTELYNLANVVGVTEHVDNSYPGLTVYSINVKFGDRDKNDNDLRTAFLDEKSAGAFLSAVTQHAPADVRLGYDAQGATKGKEL